MTTIAKYIYIVCIIVLFFSCMHSQNSSEDSIRIVPKSGIKAQVNKTMNEDCIAIQINDISFRLKKVQHGEFEMGADWTEDPDAMYWELPKHKAIISTDYFIGESSVTQELWETIMGYNPSDIKIPANPVVNVSYEDCTAFIHKLDSITGLSFRLPTELEWEFAARGGCQSIGFKFSGSDSLDEVAWYFGNSDGKTHPVMQKKPNELGLYDMTGNVWNWVSDDFSHYPDCPVQYHPTKNIHKVVKGSGWCSSEKGSRPSRRVGYATTIKSNALGFRLALHLF